MRAKGIMLMAFAVSAAGIETTDTTASAPHHPDCYDAVVVATIYRQTPTPFPNCGDDCIVMRWPWILQLDVERVSRGRVPALSLTVLTVQHTYYRPDLGERRWWLRRNSLGVFNVLSFDESASFPRCPEGTPPARPFVQPGEGRTLRDLVREGREAYGRGPSL